MIVVNSVMSGFTTEMQNRIHGILSDVVVRARSLTGFPDADWHMQRISQVAGDAIDGMTPTVRVPGMLSFRVGDDYVGEQDIYHQVWMIGIDPATQSQVSDFSKYLQHPKNRGGQVSFDLPQGGYDTRDHQAGPDAPERPQMAVAGWEWRRSLAEPRARQRQLLESDRQTRSGSAVLPSAPGQLRAAPRIIPR